MPPSILTIYPVPAHLGRILAYHGAAAAPGQVAGQAAVGTTNIPAQLTSFIGRERELADVQGLLTTTRLVTLTGPGGCGKTRLAMQLAQAASEHYRDGAWLVKLAALRDPALVPQLVAKTLGISAAPEQTALQALLERTRSQVVLIVLDNCEHLIAACAELAQQVLAETSGPRILATSREPLAIVGESKYPLAGLAWPLRTPT
jgi:predicted ATPase